MKRWITAGLACAVLAGCGQSDTAQTPNKAASVDEGTTSTQAKNVVFFLGDGMGLTTLTAARIYGAGEDGELAIDQLPETAFIKTFSNDAQVTDSAPSMSAYMTGVKMNNEVISMSQDTRAIDPNANLTGNCGAANGTPVSTFLELAKARGMGTGVVTTTRITHATPAATYSHICHRDAENDIAAQLTPGGAGYNSKLADGVDVILGGGQQFFRTTADDGKRTDGRDLLAEFRTKGYTVATTRAEFDAANVGANGKLLGLFTPSHMSYDLDRDPAKEPSLAAMTVKALQRLKQNNKGYFLMVEGGRIDHALHDTTAKKALQDTIAFDNAIKAALAEVKKTDPTLKNTLFVVTADHDHTLVLNGYAARTGKTTPSNPGVTGLVKNYGDGSIAKDGDGKPYTIIGFGNGENRVAGNRGSVADLDDATVSGNTYHQEAAVQVSAGNETHGGTNVFLGATGANADLFNGVLDNTQVFGLLRQATGL